MKLTIQDFGPINKLTLDLSKDIQFIYGENSVGKSYAMTVLYALLKSFITYFDSVFGYGLLSEKEVKRLEKQINKLVLSNKQVSHAIDEILSTELTRLLEERVVENFKNYLLTKYSSLGSISNQYSKKKFKVRLESTAINFTLNYTNGGLKLRELDLNRNSVFRVKYDKDRKSFCFSDDEFSLEVLEELTIDFILIDILMNINEVVRTYATTVYYLPASRSGIYLAMNSFSPIIAELSKNRNFLKNKTIELPGLSHDISDYFIQLSEINGEPANEALQSIVSNFERKVLKGEVVFNKRKKRITFKSYKTNIELELAETSSMIAELIPVISFLKFVLTVEKVEGNKRGESKYRNNLIIIEEPEAHLHPKIQVQLIELFSKLSKFNVKLLITSHSNYMFHKLSNLIIAGKVNVDKVATYRLRMGRNGSSDAKDMVPDKEGIEDHNFSKVSEDLFDERMRFYEKLNEQDAD